MQTIIHTPGEILSSAIAEVEVARSLIEHDSTPSSEAVLVKLEGIGAKLRSLAQIPWPTTNEMVQEALQIGIRQHCRLSPDADYVRKLVDCTTAVLKHFAANSDGTISIHDIQRYATEVGLFKDVHNIIGTRRILVASSIIEGPIEHSTNMYRLGSAGKQLSNPTFQAGGAVDAR